MCNLSVTVILTQFSLEICHCCCGCCSRGGSSLVVVFEREQVSKGFKLMPLDPVGPPPPTPSSMFKNTETFQSWPCFEARPSYRQWLMQRESRFHTKVVGGEYAGVSGEAWSALGYPFPSLEIWNVRGWGRGRRDSLCRLGNISEENPPK